MTNGTEELYNNIPRIRRARDYRLYGFDDRRYLDLCLDGGRALLGHKPGRSLLMMKNSLDKGLSASYPGIWEGRLLKQLRLLYPDIAAVSIVSRGTVPPIRSISASRETLPVYRPFEYAEAPTELYPGVPFELLLPLPGSRPLMILCASETAAAELPGAEPVPQYLFAGLCRAAAELRAFAGTVSADPWKAFDSPLWNRRGPWLYPATDVSNYRDFFRAFLANGILISPDYNVPSCAPSRFTEGEIKPIKKIESGFTAI